MAKRDASARLLPTYRVWLQLGIPGSVVLIKLNHIRRNKTAKPTADRFAFAGSDEQRYVAALHDRAELGGDQAAVVACGAEHFVGCVRAFLVLLMGADRIFHTSLLGISRVCYQGPG